MNYFERLRKMRTEEEIKEKIEVCKRVISRLNKEIISLPEKKNIYFFNHITNKRKLISKRQREQNIEELIDNFEFVILHLEWVLGMDTLSPTKEEYL